MDRREALKKLGAGSVAVVGTSLVISSPAFAFDAPSVTGAPNVFTLTTSGGKTADIVVDEFPPGSCPTSSINSGDVPTQGTPTYSWSSPDGGSGTGVVVSRGGTGSWNILDTVVVVVTLEYICEYAGAVAAQSYSWSRSFTVNSGTGGNAIWTPGIINGPTAA